MAFVFIAFVFAFVFARAFVLSFGWAAIATNIKQSFRNRAKPVPDGSCGGSARIAERLPLHEGGPARVWHDVCQRSFNVASGLT